METQNIGYILATIIIVILLWKIYTQLYEGMLQSDPMLDLLKQVMLPIHPEVKNLKLYKGEKSYTINKDKIFLCLKDGNNEYYDLNSIIYVTLHELAHKLNKEIGHGEEFQRIFNELLKRAADMKIYNPDIPMVQNYCE